MTDVSTDRERFLESTTAALDANPRVLSPQWFYDTRGAELFERICELEEYYPTRTELSIFDTAMAEIARRVGPRAAVFEPGSGAGIKTGLLLASLDDPVGYVPIDVAEDQLESTSTKLRESFPDLEVRPVHADFGTLECLPDLERTPSRTLAFFPGSTIGNFEPRAAAGFLRRLADLAGPRGAILLGVDLVKTKDVLERAYDDAQGVTAAFNRNVLDRMRRELDAEIEVDDWQHRSIFDSTHSRIEMHLVARRPTTIAIGARRWSFERGEFLTTEYSYKYSTASLERLVHAAGLAIEARWTDPQSWFAVCLLAPPAGLA